MKITPINIVSFEGEWRTETVRTHPDLMGGSSIDYKRTHIYHPDADESQESIQAVLKAMRKKFSGTNKTTHVSTKPPLLHRTCFYENTVKLGKRLLTKQKTTALESEQKTLVIRLQKITEQLKLKPSQRKISVPTKRKRKNAEPKISFKKLTSQSAKDTITKIISGLKPKAPRRKPIRVM